MTGETVDNKSKDSISRGIDPIRDRESLWALAVSNGINFLAKEQGKDGSFFSLTSSSPFNFKEISRYHTVFSNALILSCLNSLTENPRIENIKSKLVKFLLSQRNEYWSFNYWARDSKETKIMPYPDDLDDTFCTLAALYEYNQKLIDGGVLARAVTILTAVEEKEGGPYRTWLVPPTAQDIWKDVDLAVNSNIAYFLSQQDIFLPKVKKFIEDAIDQNSYTSPYYPSEYIIIYFISRWYHGKKKKKIINFLLKKQKNGIWENQLNTALAISSFLNFGISSVGEFSKSINYILKSQDKSGAWQPLAFCVDPTVKGKRHYAGSSVLTTAFCLEAINKFRNMNNELGVKSGKKSGEIVTAEQDRLHKEIVKRTKLRFAEFGKDFKKLALEVLEKTLKNDKDKQIVLLPLYFRNALGTKGRKADNDLIIQLGLANLFGWIAYTIYDDFLDEEGDPQKLSLANVCLRESVEIFETILPKSMGFSAFAKKIFDTIDNANMWEVSNCRDVSTIPNYGDYSQLANKSLGHSLGPVAILFALGYKTNSVEVKNTMRFFRNYIIARQLNDDAHDWEDDFKKGHMNAVSAQLLKDAKGESKNLKKLREIFWHTTIVGTCKDILRHVELAKKDLKKLTVIKDPEIFIEMLATIERSVEEALQEREETMKFLKTYSHRE